MNGERRTFALLRPIVDVTAQNKLRELILEAFQEYEERRGRRVVRHGPKTVPRNWGRGAGLWNV